MYCKFSPGDSDLLLLVSLENHQPKNESKISHKSTSTHENPHSKGFPAPEVLQNIS
ncbi:MAG: hypothetical protein LBC61_04605 [Candidatus Peribacteria bacterium]|nr:hypothetical protein [Candidatus Peribacteria bacterium]